MISLDNLTVSYGGWTLFDNISFLINPKDRIGLVGKNGAGKTTLLRIITGEQQPTSGTVTFNGDCTIGYLPQTMRVADTTTLVEETAKAFEEVLRLEAEIERLTREIAERTDYESPEYEQLLHRLNDAQDHYHILGGETRDADIEKTLLGLGFKREDFGRATSEFSGGWRMRIELAKLLLRRPSIFLLDEPTNHLDIESIQWLEEYLKNYNGAVLLISHDRAFLDNVTNRTIELSLGKITDYKVPYSKYVVLRAERRAQQLAAYENQQRMIEKTEEFIEKFRYKPTKSNQVQSRIKQLERLERLEVEEEDLSTLNIKFPPAPRSGQIVAEIREAGMSFGAKHVFSGANFTIEKGDRIAFVGRNGEGKTTLARMLVGQLTPTEGSIRLGANVNIGYYAQNQDDLMDGEFTVYDTLDRVAVGDIRTRLRDILGAFLFRGEDIDKKVKVLSGGERARLAMARMMLEPRNLLVLDEPTNHMDMRSKDILKNAILKYDGTVVVVSHDREFLDGMVEKVYEFRDGGVKEYLGGIYYFLEKRKLESLQEIERRDPSPKAAAAKSPAKGAAPADNAKPASSGKASYEQRKEQEKLLRKLRRNVETIEAELADIERQIAAYDAKFAAATDYNEADYKAYNDLKARYDHQMHEWEKASYELEITENA
ncbi:ribosomal protection-like ABC-F family protein [uncultured Alistipes sp.]|uniref:ribosomal protection-like ABC-F family protein n=1 Tax=uncultured Alistipes sp. TaxID=538949 RepID=UPI00261154EA|nr:ABC-F family ATP-binding cassette domain-containing protein [uncultured Alistipes sp.]